MRRAATAASSHAESAPGCVLLMSRGLPAWLAVVQRVAPRRGDGPRAAGPDIQERTDAATLAVRSDLTHVLAGLILACTQEEVRL